MFLSSSLVFAGSVGLLLKRIWLRLTLSFDTSMLNLPTRVFHLLAESCVISRGTCLGFFSLFLINKPPWVHFHCLGRLWPSWEQSAASKSNRTIWRWLYLGVCLPNKAVFAHCADMPGALGVHVCPGVAVLLSRRDVSCVSTLSLAWPEDAGWNTQIFGAIGNAKAALRKHWLR